MIVTLTGATKNIGDYLIGDRAIKLLKEFVDDEVVNLNRFNELSENLEVINKSKALFLCGGPAYADNIYPGIYSLVDNLDKIKVPIIPFGLGWSGRPFGQPSKFKFQPKAQKFLERVHNTIEFSSCRDIITQDILFQNGFENVKMTGCPVWYDLPFIGKKFKKKDDIKSIVFTTGAKVSLIKQTINLLRITRQEFPEAKIYVTFHRGILPGNGTSLKSGIAYTLLAMLSKIYNVEIRDVSFDLEKIDFYRNCDLHIGYRVHAHLYFLSKRLPSILINEDGRGQGMVESLELPVLNINDGELISKVKGLLKKYKSEKFGSFEKTGEIIDKKFLEMKDFLQNV